VNGQNPEYAHHTFLAACVCQEYQYFFNHVDEQRLEAQCPVSCGFWQLCARRINGEQSLRWLLPVGTDGNSVESVELLMLARPRLSCLDINRLTTSFLGPSSAWVNIDSSRPL
jgi:hypothetical protein